MAMVVVGVVTVIGGLIVSTIYLVRIRPPVAAAEDGRFAYQRERTGADVAAALRGRGTRGGVSGSACGGLVAGERVASVADQKRVSAACVAGARGPRERTERVACVAGERREPLRGLVLEAQDRHERGVGE